MSGKARPAFVDDVDDNTGKPVRGTRRSASTREKPKVSQSRHKSRRSQTDDLYLPEQSSSQAQHIEIPDVHEHRSSRLERRMSTSSSIKSPHKNRPPSAHENRGFPKLQIPSANQRREESTYYGVPTPIPRALPPPPPAQPQTIPALPYRPRAWTEQTYPRPQSYHAAQTSTGSHGPPLSMSAFYQAPPLVAPSYPPPSPSFMRFAAPGAPQDYFSQQPPSASRTLSSRFDPIPRTSSAFEIPRTPSSYEPMPSVALSRYDPVNRTTSAFGSRDVAPRYETTYIDDGYASASEGAATIRTGRERRNSIRVPSAMAKFESDYRAMPPPSRPSIARRPATEYTLEPMDIRYRDNQEDDYLDDPRPPPRQRAADFRDLGREDSRTRRPSVHRNSVSYDFGSGPESVRLESANSSRRRQTWYEQPGSVSTTSSGYEDKLHHAASYQEEVGGAPVPLTAEVLKRQQRRHGGSSRSTKSSQSRDDSDYKKSATTRTTRSGSGNDDENVTIKLKGQARVMVGGAQIDCNDGGEIQIQRQQNRIRGSGGSERSNSEYGAPRIEDRKSRIDRNERPTTRQRLQEISPSTRSYTRVSPEYY